MSGDLIIELGGLILSIVIGAVSSAIWVASRLNSEQMRFTAHLKTAEERQDQARHNLRGELTATVLSAENRAAANLAAAEARSTAAIERIETGTQAMFSRLDGKIDDLRALLLGITRKTKADVSA